MSPVLDHELDGRIVLVTGATRGIGRAAARLLHQAGARVALMARSPGDLEEVARELDGWALPCDVSDGEAVNRALTRLQEMAEDLPEVVVTAAGVFSLGPARELDGEELDRHLAVNLKGSVLVVRGLLPHLLERGRGTIIQVGSVAGRRALPGNAAYAASKYGLRGFHEVLLEELRGSGVRATLVEPAATDTSLWDGLDPDGDPGLPNRAEMLRPEEVAEGILWVATRPQGVQVPFLPMERG